MSNETTLPTTQRAYTLRLRGIDESDCSWRDALWATHEAVNKGAKTFGDWLLTLRGGLGHKLADEPVKEKADKTRPPTQAERRDRRILLALSWLSVEDAHGAPRDESLIVARGTDSADCRARKLGDALAGILQARGVVDSELGDPNKKPEDQAGTWLGDCMPSLSAAIREDAVWVNRSAAFDGFAIRTCGQVDRDYAARTVLGFLELKGPYFELPSLSDDESAANVGRGEEKPLVNEATGWLCDNWGAGVKNDKAQISQTLSRLTVNLDAFVGQPGETLLRELCQRVGVDSAAVPVSGWLKALFGAIGWKGGRPSAGRMAIEAAMASTSLGEDEIKKLRDKFEKEAGDKRTESTITVPIWMPLERAHLEQLIGVRYRITKDHTFEFAVMLDHAARRVSIGHSWIKRAEAERSNFESERQRIESVPTDVRVWLDEFFQDRSSATNATDSYAVRKRALGGKSAKAWKAVVEVWKKCDSEDERKKAVGQVQSDWDDDEKFGHSELFEKLAVDEARLVWATGPEALIDYVASRDAEAHKLRFKVPAYRHPDPLSHPVFCDFGNSRWNIRFAVHDARSQLDGAKTTVIRREQAVQTAQARFDKAKMPEKQADAQTKLTKAQDDLKEAGERAEWLSNRHALSMSLWDGGSLDECKALRWSSKRLSKDLALRKPTDDTNHNGKLVTRADRLGRAASGAAAESNVAILSLFDEKHWNGRLQAPRDQLDALADYIKKHHGADTATKPGSLDAIFRSDEKARKMRDRIEWLVSFSAKLECRGPFVPHALKHKLIEAGREIELAPRGGEQNEWRGIAYPIWHPANDGHKGLAKHILSRVPIRILSVDLGHRYAAACAVWETISAKEMAQACRERGHREPRESDLFIHLARTVKKERKKGRDKGKVVDVTETTVYRRIGEDFLCDPKTGKTTDTPHPAPWARLDRQFLIKLQGEEQPARAATNGKLKDGSPSEINEVELVTNMRRNLGLVRDDADDAGNRGVDELMRRSVRIATLGLKRHGRRAKIAYTFKPDCPGIPGMGGKLKVITRGDDAHIRFLTDALFDWHSLGVDTDWDGSAARKLWNEYIKPLPGGFEIGEPTPPDPNAERPTRQQRRESEEKLREGLKPVAEYFSKADPSATASVFSAWKQLWDGAEGHHANVPKIPEGQKGPARTMVIEPATGWYAHLRLLTDWIMGWHLPGAQSKSWDRNFGGLSLTRIATMKSLYQLHKAFVMRPRPHELRGAPEKGESNAGVAQSILDAMERMREQRVKQLASRIAAAALGLGGHWKQVEPRDHKGKVLLGKDGKPQMKRVWVEEPSAKYLPCHAVVIENLRSYRPDELQTRRENRSLMNWSSGKVRKYLEEACQLHGLHLREVMPNYTSRQDSRTGLPGVRCDDVSVADFLDKSWWRKAVKRAKERKQNPTKDKPYDAEAQLLVALDKQWPDRKDVPESERAAYADKVKSEKKPIRLITKGGDLFVAAPPSSCQANGHRPCPLCDGKRALQADLNAAANIGLRALLDPDFPGKWWYVPCGEVDGAPLPDKVKGSACFPENPANFGSLRKVKEQVQPVIDLAVTDVAKKKPKAQKQPNNKSKPPSGRSKKKEVVNFWANPSATAHQTAVDNGSWLPTPDYWKEVRDRVIELLRQHNFDNTNDTPF